MKSVMNALGLREDADEKSALEAVNALKKDAADKAALEAQNTKLVKERDDAVQAQESLHEQQVRARVKSLVGKKFTPAEEEDQVKLALQSPELFERLTEQRADIKVLNRDPVGDGQQTQATERVTGADDNGTDFANMVNEIPLS